MYWRNTWWEGKIYPSCEDITLSEGMLVSHNYDAPVQYIQQAIYRQICYENSIPVLNTNVGLVIDKFSQPLPLVAESWVQFTRHSIRGTFNYSVVSIIYAISVSAVIIWFLTIFVLTNYTVKPTWLLKMSTLLSTVYIAVVVIKSIIILHIQQREGYLHGAKLLDEINSNKAVNIIDLIVVLLLQINQVQVIMRIFQRQKDKRLTFFVGLIASLTSQVIWGVSQFYFFDENNEAGDILPAFIYLVRIAMALCYAAIITVYFISKIKIIVANKKIWLLTLLTFILIYSPVAFFIADVSNAFVYELSEIFSVVNYVIGVVIPWEWCNKFNLIMKKREKEGVLGRRFYEDELYELDRFELFVKQDEENHSSNDDDDDNTSTPKETDLSNKFLSTVERTKHAFLALTDTIIAAGFAIPRSVSVSTQSLKNKRDEEFNNQETNQHLNKIDNATMNQLVNTDSSTVATSENNVTSINTHSRNRRNVYVYARKEVVLEDSSSES
ncbi:unnamed protein product [Candida verbasci]|uniref:pH-response regulator protein palH/RIM21 n=1 Tax=Candida verbasci TaxID=1227364 RepID=A0A9W4U0K1_9ASCO|nr:unnamed protein product [Candida verbasci]